MSKEIEQIDEEIAELAILIEVLNEQLKDNE